MALCVKTEAERDDPMLPQELIRTALPAIEKNFRELHAKNGERESTKDYLYSQMDEIKTKSPEQMRATLEENLRRVDILTDGADNENVKGKDGLSEVEKSRIREESGWPDEITDQIHSVREYEIYQNAGLQETKINGKPALTRTDINWNQKDQFGKTNIERMEQGRAPLGSNGRPIELHHIGQHNDSPLAELTLEEHRGKGNDTILHNKTIESEIDRVTFESERIDHWKERAIIEGAQ